VTGDVIWIHLGVDGVMIVRVNLGGRLGMWMLRCSGVTVGVPAQGYYRDIAGDVAPMCWWYMPVGVGRTRIVHIYVIRLGGGESDVALA